MSSDLMATLISFVAGLLGSFFVAGLVYATTIETIKSRINLLEYKVNNLIKFTEDLEKISSQLTLSSYQIAENSEDITKMGNSFRQTLSSIVEQLQEIKK